MVCVLCSKSLNLSEVPLFLLNRTVSWYSLRYKRAMELVHEPELSLHMKTCARGDKDHRAFPACPVLLHGKLPWLLSFPPGRPWSPGCFPVTLNNACERLLVSLPRGFLLVWGQDDSQGVLPLPPSCWTQKHGAKTQVIYEDGQQIYQKMFNIANY